MPMRIRKTPQQKKRLSLAKDHPVNVEHPHAFRKSWPAKKRFAQKKFRHAVAQELNRVKGVSIPQIPDVDVNGIRRKTVKKWGSSSLGEVIKRKHARRIVSFRRKKNAQMERR